MVLSCRVDWTQALTELPQLTSLILEDYSPTGQESRHCFSNLKRLHLKRPEGPWFKELLPLLPPQLTHLSLCDFDREEWEEEAFPNDLEFDKMVHLANLTSLACHCFVVTDPEELLQIILSTFPQLRHLSLCGSIELVVVH